MSNALVPYGANGGANGITKATIRYWWPDRDHLFQTIEWKDYDTYPLFPSIARFVRLWERIIGHPVYSVRVEHPDIDQPVMFKQPSDGWPRAQVWRAES